LHHANAIVVEEVWNGLQQKVFARNEVEFSHTYFSKGSIAVRRI
jgi:hypothetical protein